MKWGGGDYLSCSRPVRFSRNSLSAYFRTSAIVCVNVLMSLDETSDLCGEGEEETYLLVGFVDFAFGAGATADF